jgi:hypothetical protein
MRFRRSLSDSAFGARIAARARADCDQPIWRGVVPAAAGFNRTTSARLRQPALGRTFLKAGRKADSRGVFRTVLGSLGSEG